MSSQKASWIKCGLITTSIAIALFGCGGGGGGSTSTTGAGPSVLTTGGVTGSSAGTAGTTSGVTSGTGTTSTATTGGTATGSSATGKTTGGTTGTTAGSTTGSTSGSTTGSSTTGGSTTGGTTTGGSTTGGSTTGGGASGGAGSTSASVNVTNTGVATSLQLVVPGGPNVQLTWRANSLSQPTTVSANYIASSALPSSIVHNVRHRTRSFSLNTNNIYVSAFSVGSTPTISNYNSPVSITGSSIPSAFPQGTVLNVAVYTGGSVGGQWSDVGTLYVGSGSAFGSNYASVGLPGVSQPGTYVIYEPAPGSSTTVANYGLAYLGGYDGNIYVANLLNSSGNPIATPPLSQFAFQGYDLDGQTLTPNGVTGVLADGSSSVRFFTTSAGVPTTYATTIDVTNYCGAADCVAITPDGDTAVVTEDGATTLTTISGIATSSTPQLSDSITSNGDGDGMVMSIDGKTLLTRGMNGVSVFAVTKNASPTTGALGGPANYAFTHTVDFPALSIPFQENGRDGMAISPADSSRALVVGEDPNTFAPTVTLLTGLPNSPASHTAKLRLPAAKRHMKSRTGRGAVSGVNYVYSVAISPDGTYAVVGSDLGLVLITGINTGNISQVSLTPTGTATSSSSYDPLYTPAGASQTDVGPVYTLAFTLDGKYIALQNANGSLLVFPTYPTGFGAQVSQVDNISVLGNDQLIVH